MRSMITTAALAAMTTLGLVGCDSSSDPPAADTEAEVEAEAEASEPAAAVKTDRRDRRRAFRAERIARFDADGDGKLDETERAAMRAGRIERMIESVDTDGDGAVSKAEADAIEGRRKRMFGDFASLDSDGDGKITAAELGEAMKDRGPRRRRAGPSAE
jgi:hypothetical protein